ncbi:hypothetical protein SLS62_002511 [Diatrype stigma]|uniref:Uncharacterized protein n=1 Tax=Diatrype stigma TaxID=117547 RepID=A0AAN9UXC7_9PEZI
MASTKKASVAAVIRDRTRAVYGPVIKAARQAKPMAKISKWLGGAKQKAHRRDENIARLSEIVQWLNTSSQEVEGSQGNGPDLHDITPQWPGVPMEEEGNAEATAVSRHDIHQYPDQIILDLSPAERMLEVEKRLLHTEPVVLSFPANQGALDARLEYRRQRFGTDSLL